MTLSFILSSMKRHGRLVVVLAVIGLLGGLAMPFLRSGVYMAEAELLIQPPESAGAGVDLDKFVAAQLSLLGSTALVKSVSDEVPGSSIRSIRNSVSVTLEPPNSVRIAVIDADPGRAKLIADQYAEQYLADQRRRLASVTDRELSLVTTQLTAVIAEIDRTAIALAANPTDAVVVSKMTSLQDRRVRLEDQKSQLEFVASEQQGSELVQPPELPKTKEGLSPVEWALVGLFGGVFGGVVLAAAWAANSGQLLDARQLEELLGVPVAARLPVVGALSKEPSAGLEILPAAIASRIDRLCVRAEGVGAANGRQLRVAVVGTGAECGVTTLALMLGARMAQSRMNVGLMDADALNPWISRRLSRSAVELIGRADPVANGSSKSPVRPVPSAVGARAASGSPAGEVELLSSAALEVSGFELTTLATSVERLVVVGEGARAEQAFQKATLETVWRALDDVDVDIVVFDAGSLMDAALSVRLCQQVDAVILLVPLARQNVDQLRVVKRLFDGRPVEILPVVTDVVARRQLD